MSDSEQIPFLSRVSKGLRSFSRYAKFGVKVARANFGALRGPFKLTYVITKECHSKCLNCSIWQVKPKNELTLEEIQALAKNSPFLSWVDFTGGEPTDRKDFVEIIKAFADNCPDLLFAHFPTNGLKPPRIEAACRELKKLNLPKLVVTVSIDGPPELNDKLRGIPGDFERATETFRKIDALGGIDVYVGMTLFPENCNLVHETLAALQARIPGFDIRRLHVNIGHTSSHYYENSERGVTPSSEMVAALDDLMKSRGVPLAPFSWIERIYQRRARRYVESGKSPTPCAALHASCFLTEEGTVHPCNIWSAPLGNIRENQYSLLPILRGEKGRAARADVEKLNCPNCWTPCEAYQSILTTTLNPSGMRGTSA